MLGLAALSGFDVLGPIVMSTILAIEQHLHDVLLSYLDALHLLLPLDAFTFHYNYWLGKLHREPELPPRFEVCRVRLTSLNDSMWSRAA